MSDYPNWIDEGNDIYTREIEGRKTKWLAEVSKHEGEYVAEVVKREPMKLHECFSLAPRDLSPASAAKPQETARSESFPRNEKRWVLAGFDTPQRAIKATEEFLRVRTDPATWRGAMTPEARRILSTAIEVKGI